jgi:hypothetical protein
VHSDSGLLLRLPCPVSVVCVVWALLFGFAFSFETFSSGNVQVAVDPGAFV